MSQQIDKPLVVAELPSQNPDKYLFRVTEAGHTELVEIDRRPGRLAASYGAIMTAIDVARERRKRAAAFPAQAPRQPGSSI